MKPIRIFNRIKSSLSGPIVRKLLLESNELLYFWLFLFVMRLIILNILLEKITFWIFREKWVKNKICQWAAPFSFFFNLKFILYKFMINLIQNFGIDLLNRPLTRQKLLPSLLLEDAVRGVVILDVVLNIRSFLKEILIRIFNHFDLSLLMSEAT